MDRNEIIVPATVTLAVALTVLAPALCLLEARHVYRAGLLAVSLRTDRITSPTRVSSTDEPEIWKEKTTFRKQKKVISSLLKGEMTHKDALIGGSLTTQPSSVLVFNQLLKKIFLLIQLFSKFVIRFLFNKQ